MSNYVLSLELTGDEQVNAQLDKLMSSMDKLSSGKVSISDILHKEELAKIDSQIDKSGILAGETFSKSFSKSLKKSLKPFDNADWAKAILKPSNDAEKFWQNAIKVGQKEATDPMGALAKFINQRHAPGGKMVDRDFWLKAFPPQVTKGLPEITGKDLAKVQSLEDISNIGKAVTKGLRDVTGKDLAKVNSLGDITQFDQIKRGMDIKKLLMGAGTALFNPWIGSRLMSDAMPPKPKGGGPGAGVAAGIFGTGGAMGFAEFYIAIQAFRKAVGLFVSIVRGSLERADKLYSSAIQSGLGLNFAAKRGSLARIMGVSEQDVFRFGAQMAYLNPKLENANRIFSETAIPLTSISWEFKVLELNMESLFAKMVNEMAPELLKFAEALNIVIVGLINGVEVMEKLWKIGKWMPTSIILRAATGEFTRAMIEKLLGANGKQIPGAGAWMKQLPASTWEKMGLVTMGGGQNFAKETATNTKNTAIGIRELLNQVKKQKQNGTFNMSPTVNNP